MFGLWFTSNRCTFYICNQYTVFVFFFRFPVCFQYGAEVVIGREITIYTQSESEEQVQLCAVSQSGILAVMIPAINIRFVNGSAVTGDSLFFYKQLIFCAPNGALQNVFHNISN